MTGAGPAVLAGGVVQVKAHRDIVLAAGASGFALSAPLRYLYHWLWRKPPSVVIPYVLLASWVTALA